MDWNPARRVQHAVFRRPVYFIVICFLAGDVLFDATQPGSCPDVIVGGDDGNAFLPSLADIPVSDVTLHVSKDNVVGREHVYAGDAMAKRSDIKQVLSI